MPMPNYHAARVRDPGGFSRIVTLKTFPNGVMLLGGPLKGSPNAGSTAQSYRFPKSKFTAAQARKWLKDHDIKASGFEAASGKSEAVKEMFLQEGCFEAVTFEEAEAGNVVHNVVLLGANSLNKRRYTEGAMRRAAPLYEGIKCFLNHTTHGEMQAGRRNVDGIAGKFVNVRFAEDQCKLKADAVLLKDDPAGRKFWNIARQMPDVAGLSHNATGRMKRANGEDIVEEITNVISVDLVAEPATTAGMYEDHDPHSERTSEMEWEDVTLDDLKKRRHDIYEAIVAEGKTSRDDEVKKLTEAKEKIEGELDTLKVKEATREKEAVVEKALKDLPEHAVTDTFRRMCMNVKPDEGTAFDEAVAELVKDRKEATEATGVRNMGGDKTLDKPAKEEVEKRAEGVNEALAL